MKTLKSLLVTAMAGFLFIPLQAEAQMDGSAHQQHQMTQDTMPMQKHGSMGMMNGKHGQMMNMQNHPMHRSMMLIRALPNMDQLDLTDQQAENLESLQSDFMQSHKGQMQAMMNNRQQLNKALKADKVNRENVQSLVESQSTLMEGMHLSLINTRLDMLEVLNDNQRSQLQKFSSKEIATSAKHQMKMMGNQNMQQMMPMCQQMMDGRMMKENGSKQ